MEAANTVCPVCTLFLRPGITLKQHLSSHPKQKVIDALVKIALFEEPQKSQNAHHQEGLSGINQTPSSTPFLNQVPMGHSSNVGPFPGNNFFIYQQSMSTTSPHQSNVLPINSLNQQYLVPAVYNPQMMPYFYQQQQLIMSSNGIPPQMRALPFEMPSLNSNQANEGVVSRPSEVSAAVQECVTEKEILTEVQESCEEELPESETQDNLTHLETAVEVHQVKEQDSLNIEQVEQKVEIKDNLFLPEDYSEDHEDHSYYHDNEMQEETQPDVDHEECVGSPLSHTSNSQNDFYPELNKACQTQNNANASPRSSIHESFQEEPAVITDATSEAPKYVYIDHGNNVSVVFTSDNVPTSYEQAQPIYTSANVLNNSEAFEFVNMEDLEGMQVIIGDFPSSSVVPSQSEAYDNIGPERPAILMTIGDVTSKNDQHGYIIDHKINESEESCISSVNIHSDEKMPPRGELSGQESMGSASDITWNQIQNYQEQSHAVSFENNSWEDSNTSGINMVSSQEFVEEKQYEKVMKQEPEEEVLRNNTEKSKTFKLVGLDIGQKKTKKLIIKPKRQKTETSFDNVFRNKLKLEDKDTEDPDDMGLEPEAIKEAPDEKPKKLISTTCRECHEVFPSKKMLKIHQVDIHNLVRIKINKCAICEEVFDVENKFTEHLKTHPLECRICGKLFYKRLGLKYHTARHLGIKPFKCDMCDKAFLTKQKLEEHRNVHTGNSPIKCSMCDETFKRHSNLVQHRNKHHFKIKKKIRDYICYCGEVFHSKKKLAWHKEIHDLRPKACTQCSEKFVHVASLTRHMRKAHNAEYLPDERKNNQVNAICPICKGCFLRSSLEAHVKNHSGEKPYACSICSKDFTTKWNLKLHRWTHASRTQKPYKCDLCKGAFIRESDYVAHMNSHKSVRPYTCNYCGAQFIRKYNCQRHVKEHENDKTYNCNVCGKSFHRSYYLKDHMRVHSGIRPYSCHICGKTSTTKSNHNKHVSIHHAREPVSTEN